MRNKSELSDGPLTPPANPSFSRTASPLLQHGVGDHLSYRFLAVFRFLDAAFRFTRSGSFFFPVSRFHSSKV